MVSESSAENILEEASEESASDFASEISTENQRESAKQSEKSVSAKASGTWGWGSAEASAGYNSKSSSHSMAKNVSNVSDKLSNKLSAKRKVSIDIKREVQESVELHDEVETTREFRNPNKGHTVTFNWFQMTRKLATVLKLEDVQFVYTSGKHNPARVFVNGDMPLFEDETINNTLQSISNRMPPDIAQLMPPGSVIVVVTEPYTEVVPMSGTNAFLSRVFKAETASEIGSTIWQVAGSGNTAPDGLGIAAFSDKNKPSDDWKAYTELFSEDPSAIIETKPEEDSTHVVADKIRIKLIGSGNGDEETICLPNIDLRFKAQGGPKLVRYHADQEDTFALPLELFSKDQVVNTNGVYCEAMPGQVTVLEPYLQKHRELDLLEKRIEVGNKELELRWAAAKDGMRLLESDNGAIAAIVEEKVEGQGFAARKDLEQHLLEEQKDIAKAQLEKQRKKQEIELLKQQVAELEKEVEQLGQPKAYSFNVPNEAHLNIIAHLGTENEAFDNTVHIETKDSDTDL